MKLRFRISDAPRMRAFRIELRIGIVAILLRIMRMEFRTHPFSLQEFLITRTPDSSSISQCDCDAEFIPRLRKRGRHCPSVGVSGRRRVECLWSPCLSAISFQTTAQNTLAKSCFYWRYWLWRSCVAGRAYHVNHLQTLSSKTEAYNGCVYS